MKVTFTKRDNNAYSTVAVRDDNILLSVPAHDRPKIIPHDMAHLIVERELRLTSGFWGKVANGAIFDGMKVLSGRQKPAAQIRSKLVIRDGKQLGTQAEELVSVMVRIAFSELDKDWKRAKLELSEIWTPPKGAIIEWTPERLSKIATELREASMAWQELAIDQSMDFCWPAKTSSVSRNSTYYSG
jgi:hypothetical protein